MSEFKFYSRKGYVEARPWTQEDEDRFVINGLNHGKVSVSLLDSRLRTRIGGMVARNPNNHEDQWYINKDFFEANYHAHAPE